MKENPSYIKERKLGLLIILFVFIFYRIVDFVSMCSEDDLTLILFILWIFGELLKYCISIYLKSWFNFFLAILASSLEYLYWILEEVLKFLGMVVVLYPEWVVLVIVYMVFSKSICILLANLYDRYKDKTKNTKG